MDTCIIHRPSCFAHSTPCSSSVDPTPSQHNYSTPSFAFITITDQLHVDPSFPTPFLPFNNTNGHLSSNSKKAAAAAAAAAGGENDDGQTVKTQPGDDATEAAGGSVSFDEIDVLKKAKYKLCDDFGIHALPVPCGESGSDGEIAHHGAAVTLYFKLLKALIITFGLMTVLSIPAMVIYNASGDQLTGEYIQMNFFW